MFRILAGTPPMVALSGTSLTTTALGAINTLLPIVIRPITLAPGEIISPLLYLFRMRAVFLSDTGYACG